MSGWDRQEHPPFVAECLDCGSRSERSFRTAEARDAFVAEHHPGHEVWTYREQPW